MSFTHEQRVLYYDALIDSHLSIERKGKNNPYTSLNGNMYSIVTKEGFGLRLAKDEREEFMRKYDSRLFESYGAVMKEYVLVPDSLLQNTKELLVYLERSLAYAKTLKSKPTNKKKKK